MENEGLFILLDSITKKLENYESGDLMSVADIKSGYEEVQTVIKDIEAFDKTMLDTGVLPALAWTLASPRGQAAGDEDRIKTMLITADRFLSDYLKNPETAETKENLEKLNQEIKTFIQKPTAEAEKKDPYEGYFNNIVDDKKMLGQLSEEIKEHLDTAQYTLVELEFNDTDQENINKVFRSFHTIKGSSAFLGLKNIEEVGHEIESLLVLVRDGKLHVSKELIDVIFMGIEILRTLVSIMETNLFEIDKMIKSFVNVDIFSYIKLIKQILVEYPTKKIGEILSEGYLIFHRDVETILNKQKETGKKFGEIAIEENLVTEEDLSDALKKQQVPPARRTSYVKVSNERLNSLIDIVGELVINQSMLKQVTLNSEGASDNFERTLSQLEFITTTIKNLVLSMGMVSVSEIFNKLRVVVRNTAQESGKTVCTRYKRGRNGTRP